MAYQQINEGIASVSIGKRKDSGIMRSRNALVVINFHNAHQTLRNCFGQLLQLEQWTRFPGVPNAYCTTFLSDASDEDLVEQAESDMSSAAISAGIEEWDACCFLEESIVPTAPMPSEEIRE